MCGICGKLHFDPDRPADRPLLQRMSDVIAHRGPDGSGAYVSGPVALGHRRLAIIDLHTGDQPIGNEDGQIQVVFNGEIYNHRALRARLERQGHRFRTETDTEVIVHLYEEMGDDCVSMFEGMFAFALWDERRRRLLLARDRVGIKPLYWTDTGRSLLFGSEIKSLLVDPEVRVRLDPQSLEAFLKHYYLPGERTLVEGIHKLRPGHTLSVERGRVEVRRYWDLKFREPARAPSFEAATEQLRQLLQRSVSDHMMSDVPVGVLLSGGVDSSAVLGFAAAQSAEPLHSFTIGFDGEGVIDERPYARLAATHFGSVHHEARLDAEDFRDFLPKYVWHMEEPVCEPPAVALHAVAQLARQSGVKVLLSGEGGDEAFGGYQDYRNLLIHERLKRLLGPARPLLAPLYRALAVGRLKGLQHYADLVRPAMRDYYFSRTATPSTPLNRLRASLYPPGMHRVLERSAPETMARDLWDRADSGSLLGRMLYVDTMSWLPDDLLVKADKMTMATSVELRVPLLDHRVLEFAAALPAHYKVQGLQLKRILKAALAPVVPRAILERPKAGFPVPYDRWLRHDLRDYVHDTLLSPNALSAAWISRGACAELLAAHQRGERVGKDVFCLLVLELWHRQFIGSRPGAADDRRGFGAGTPLGLGPTPSLAV